MLHKKGYTIRQITEELHMSSRDVEDILKKYKKEEREVRDREIIEKEEEEKKRVFSSKRSEALQLYKEGQCPLDVAIKLKISAEEAKEFYQEYCSLLSPPQFLQIYMELNKTDSFNDVIDLFHLIREKGLSNEEGVESLGMVKDISLLKKEHDDLVYKIANLRKIHDFLIADNKSLKYQNEEMDQSLYSKRDEIDIKEKALEIITKKIREKQKELHKINSGEDYFKARKKIKLLVEEFLSSKKKSNFIISYIYH